MPKDASNPSFESVDWDQLEARRQLPRLELTTFAIGFILLAGMFLYDWYIAHVYFVLDWTFDLHVWAFMLGLWILFCFGVIPSIRRWDRTSRILRALLSTPRTAFALLVVAALGVIGLVGPLFFGSQLPQFGYAYTPPVGFSSELSWNSCAGEVTGDAFERVCHGTWDYPFGTDYRGFPIHFLLVSGARIALYVIVFTAAFIVPLAVATGLIAGLRGGLVDDLLMAYVDVQLTLPAIIVYFVGYIYWNVSMMLLLVVFGLLSWGGVARLVRSETLQRREEGHVRVARGLGASEYYVAIRHILPNITNTVVPAAFHLLALLILVEAGIAFLGYHDINLYSWGSTIAEGSTTIYNPGLVETASEPAYRIWWISFFPAMALGVTLLAFKLLGDGVRDVLAPG